MLPDLRSPASFVVPAAQVTQMFELTYSSASHGSISSQFVLFPAAEFPAAFIFPAGQSSHAFADTYSSSAQRISVHTILVLSDSIPTGHSSQLTASSSVVVSKTEANRLLTLQVCSWHASNPDVSEANGETHAKQSLPSEPNPRAHSSQNCPVNPFEHTHAHPP